LRYVKSIEVLEEPEVLERGSIFRWQLQGFTNLIIGTLCEVFIMASNSKVINLVQQEHFGTLKGGRVYGTIMCGAFEAKLCRS